MTLLGIDIKIYIVLLDNNQKPIDNIPYPYISFYRPIIEKQYSNCIATRQCLIQQHSIIKYKQKYACASIFCSAKKNNKKTLWNVNME
jgi:hypothetical protein